MYDISRALSDHDLPTLRIIGEWYEVDLTGHQKSACVSALAEMLSSLDLSLELSYLPPEEKAAFMALVDTGGRMPVAKFERDHGLVRQMGPGRLEREEPWLDPVSPAEALWYRGFLFRAFDDNEDSSLEEYYYIPNQLKDQFESPSSSGEDEEQASMFPVVGDIEQIYSVSVWGEAIDDITGLLAYAQNDPIIEDSISEIRGILLQNDPARSSLLYTLAWEMGLLKVSSQGSKPTRKVVKWLEEPRSVRERDLTLAWMSSGWSELFHTPGIECEPGRWDHDPTSARKEIVEHLPRDQSWYNLTDLVTSIKSDNPDFQRPGSNYDTWYIRDSQSGEYLAGFKSWDYVEGNQLRYLVQGPMFWLGLVDLASPDSADGALFRLTSSGLSWLENNPPIRESITIPVVVRDNATIAVPFNANAYHRFQVARIADAMPPEIGLPFEYRLTPASLGRAQEQGIEPERVVNFLKQASGRALPAGTNRAIERWGESGTEARLERHVILRVRDSVILDKLRTNPKTQPFIAETLGDLAVSIREGDEDELRSAIAQLGLLLDDDTAWK